MLFSPLIRGLFGYLAGSAGELLVSEDDRRKQLLDRLLLLLRIRHLVGEQKVGDSEAPGLIRLLMLRFVLSALARVQARIHRELSWLLGPQIWLVTLALAARCIY